MTREKAYLILQSAVCVLLAALLAAAAVGIYREGRIRAADNPQEAVYTRQIVMDRLAGIAPLFFLSAGMTAAGLILGVRDKGAEKAAKDAELTRDLTVSRVSGPTDAMIRERKLRKRTRIAGWAVFALCMTPIAVFLLDTNNFPGFEGLERMFHALLRVLVPRAALGLCALAAAALVCERSFRRETEAAKACPKEEKGKAVRSVPKVNARRLRIIRTVLVAAAVLLIAAGIFNGSALDVLIKAITICTECIGLG